MECRFTHRCKGSTTGYHDNRVCYCTCGNQLVLQLHPITDIESPGRGKRYRASCKGDRYGYSNYKMCMTTLTHTIPSGFLPFLRCCHRCVWSHLFHIYVVDKSTAVICQLTPQQSTTGAPFPSPWLTTYSRSCDPDLVIIREEQCWASLLYYLCLFLSSQLTTSTGSKNLLTCMRRI